MKCFTNNMQNIFWNIHNVYTTVEMLTCFSLSGTLVLEECFRKWCLRLTAFCYVFTCTVRNDIKVESNLIQRVIYRVGYSESPYASFCPPFGLLWGWSFEAWDFLDTAEFHQAGSSVLALDLEGTAVSQINCVIFLILFSTHRPLAQEFKMRDTIMNDCQQSSASHGAPYVVVHAPLIWPSIVINDCQG